jgi:hypothetical protein
MDWITRNMKRYERDGFGLVAMKDRNRGEFLCDYGPMIQHAEGESHVDGTSAETSGRTRPLSSRRNELGPSLLESFQT